MEQVKQAVRDAGLEKDVADMPMGLHTVLSEGDGSISGGQKQRILIARAIVGKPKLLFFDEATSALDNATQAVVCESLDRLHATRVVIAHRLSTIIHCDRIFVMDAGQIVEEGNFEQLMAQKGLFYQLASRQML
jgi:ATP-binding cassette subfamily C protein